jgi:hypothetical protein
MRFAICNTTSCIISLVGLKAILIATEITTMEVTLWPALRYCAVERADSWPFLLGLSNSLPSVEGSVALLTAVLRIVGIVIVVTIVESYVPRRTELFPNQKYMVMPDF